MKTLKFIGNLCCIILATIGFAVSLAFVYYHFFVDEITVGVNYINDQVGLDIIYSDDLTDEEKSEYEDRYFLEANYYSNNAKNGHVLQELNFNYFTDYTLTSDKYRSSGMQLLDSRLEDFYGCGIDTKHFDETIYPHVVANYSDYYEMYNETFNEKFNDAYYYDTTNGISFDGSINLSTKLERETELVIKIDNRAFSVSIDKNYVYNQYSYTPIFQIQSKQEIEGGYTFFNVFADCMQAIKSNSKGYGDYYITLDLSRYFSIKEFDMETGKYKADDVTDIIKTYSVLKFHYYENGALNAKQSLFGCINLNSTYGLEDEVDTTYWQEKVIYNLTEDKLSYRYSEVYEGYLVSLKLEVAELIFSMSKVKCNVVLNLQSEYLKENKLNVIGFDYDAFKDFKLDTVTITGPATKLYMLNNCLFDTSIKTLKHSNGITFEFFENATNNTYTEVII